MIPAVMSARRFVERLQKAKEKYRKHALIALAMLILILFFGRTVKPLIVVVAFIVVASFSTFYQNYFRSPISFELVKLCTITGSVAYGFAAGVIIGTLSVILSRALSG